MTKKIIFIFLSCIAAQTEEATTTSTTTSSAATTTVTSTTSFTTTEEATTENTTFSTTTSTTSSSTTTTTTTSTTITSTTSSTTDPSIIELSENSTEIIYSTWQPTTTTSTELMTTSSIATTTTSIISTIGTETTSTTFPLFDTDTTTVENDQGAAGIHQYAPGDQITMMPYGNDNVESYGPVAGAYGDPHFMVRSEHGEPICFDYNPLLASRTMMLLTDPRAFLTVLAKTEERGDTGRLFMTEISIMTPLAQIMKINSEGVFVNDEIVSEVGSRNGIHVYSDLTFKTTWAKEGNHEHTNIEIENGPVFLVKGNLKKESLSFAITDATGISKKAKGIIGRFIADDSYVVHKSNDDPLLGIVQAGKNFASAELKHYHQEKNCWVIDETDALRMLKDV